MAEVPAATAVSRAALYTRLSHIPEPRSPQGRRYPLPVLLGVLLVGLCCGCQGYLSVARWTRHLRPTDQVALGLVAGRTPCAGTFLNLFRVLDWEAFAQQLRSWVETVCLSEPPAASAASAAAAAAPVWQGWALDGKTLRGSLAAGSDLAHIVGLVAHGLGWNLTEVGVAQKQGELTVAPTLLAPVLGPGRVITGDALFTQRSLCSQILAGGSEYLFTVKENQATLLAEVQTVLGPLPAREARKQQRRWTETVNAGHGRRETRVLLAAAVSEEQVHWPGIAQVFLLERRRYHPAKAGQAARHSRELMYGITSLTVPEAGPETLLQLQRGHWSVENQVHWILDTFFREDERRIKDGKVARGLAACRRGALNLLRCLGGRSIPTASDQAKANPLRILELMGVPTKN
jgi:predicted transposase YbfD/YdcC